MSPQNSLTNESLGFHALQNCPKNSTQNPQPPFSRVPQSKKAFSHPYHIAFGSRGLLSCRLMKSENSPPDMYSITKKIVFGLWKVA